jgi:hypothetical protein
MAKCKGISSAGYKFVFLRVQPSLDRFHLILGLFGHSNTWHFPGGSLLDFQGGPQSSSYFDGKWHRWRFHGRVGVNGIATVYLDDKPIKIFGGINVLSKAIYGIALGRNMNQGPDQPVSVNWGVIRAWRTDPGWGF